MDKKDIKLMDDFFDNKGPIDYLLSLPSGENYVVFYLKLILDTSNSDGEISYFVGNVKEKISADKMSQDLNVPIEIVKSGMELFKDLDLIKANEEGFETLTGYGYEILPEGDQ